MDVDLTYRVPIRALVLAFAIARRGHPESCVGVIVKE